MAVKISNWLGTRSHRSHLCGALVEGGLDVKELDSIQRPNEVIWARKLLQLIGAKSFVQPLYIEEALNFNMFLDITALRAPS